MGASASVPERVDQPTAELICGDKFSAELFAAMAGKDALVPLHLLRMRQRLITLGTYASIELSPADVAGEIGAKTTHLPSQQSSGKPSSKVRFSLQGAFEAARANGSPSPLAPGTSVFVNHVKKNMRHFDDVTRACKVLRDHSMRPVPHVPACRFDKDDSASVSQVLENLRSAGAHEILLLGGNDAADRNAGLETH